MGMLQDYWRPGASWLEEEAITGTQRMRTQTLKNTKMQNQSIVSSFFSPNYVCAFDLVICPSLPSSLIFQVFLFFCGFGSFPFNSVFRGSFIASGLKSDFRRLRKDNIARNILLHAPDPLRRRDGIFRYMPSYT